VAQFASVIVLGNVSGLIDRLVYTPVVVFRLRTDTKLTVVTDTPAARAMSQRSAGPTAATAVDASICTLWVVLVPLVLVNAYKLTFVSTYAGGAAEADAVADAVALGEGLALAVRDAEALVEADCSGARDISWAEIHGCVSEVVESPALAPSRPQLCSRVSVTATSTPPVAGGSWAANAHTHH
jgi:hypothetical protein